MSVTTEPTTTVDPDRFRGLLRHQAAAVTVITAAGQPPVGFTATSFTSVSLHPPLVSFCIAHNTSSWPVIARADHIAVHLLTRNQDDIARTFATSGIDRFAGHARWSTGPHGVPVLPDALAWLVCRVTDRITAGDHAIVLAEPVAGEHNDGEPLIYHRGRYAGLHRDAVPPNPTQA
ncbi:flavin reductase [Micromonospora echinospora]|uniref:NADH-FMN oxidoreductase RutF, flavin reductase (DIM6/NTAB) family n=1 Tax=Micromonospora echinospora TaxID=1877 RepID=A0A1C4YU36_MICEC|nr:flavin reductase family protein [Micromonospora echinospora]OZV77425.1 flavin reductase [Micromonospora echinospora]SCF24279.1 NADH-FMN oxidoreductase RutF, flavin reductase (DIM6/NTAB) family [Micromonospora echinospora]